MNIRRATEGDRDGVRELWQEFETEVPPPPGYAESWEEAWADLSRHVRDGDAFVAEDDEGLVGYVFAAAPVQGRVHVTDLHVRPRARRRGLGTALLRAVAAAARARAAGQLTLDVVPANAVALSLYDRLGFAERHRTLGVSLDDFDARASGERAGPTFGSVHVQTDDAGSVERAVRTFVPRLPGGSRGTVVTPPRNGWIAVYDELCDREPPLLRRLARELSDRLGAVVVALGLERGSVVRYVLLERGRVVDDYLSVPEFHGPLPPGDVVALGANPTAVARLTGADPARVRAVARTAARPEDLPPAGELLASIADALGLEGGMHGYAQAVEEFGQIPPA